MGQKLFLINIVSVIQLSFVFFLNGSFMLILVLWKIEALIK